VTSVDQSAAMIDRQRQRLRRRGLDSSASWRQLDARDFQAERESAELIVTAFFLDCFDRNALACLIPQISRALSPAGLWYVVDFQHPPSGGWRARRAAIWLAGMHAFFRCTTGLETRRLADPDPILAENGFECIARADRNGTLLTSRIYRLAHACK
jgi:ubiquinone/menaquinone biosynthesis C-methylase UbiE